jgi:hypothetical protein
MCGCDDRSSMSVDELLAEQDASLAALLGRDVSRLSAAQVVASLHAQERHRCSMAALDHQLIAGPITGDGQELSRSQVEQDDRSRWQLGQIANHGGRLDLTAEVFQSPGDGDGKILTTARDQRPAD